MNVASSITLERGYVDIANILLSTRKEHLC